MPGNGLIENIVLRAGTISRVKTQDFDRAMTVLVHCFLHEGVAFGEIGHQVLFWWWLCCCYKDCNSVAGLFFFISSFYCLSAVCIRNTFGYYVVAEAVCNWYILDINIYSLSKKYSDLGKKEKSDKISNF